MISRMPMVFTIPRITNQYGCPRRAACQSASPFQKNDHSTMSRMMAGNATNAPDRWSWSIGNSVNSLQCSKRKGPARADPVLAEGRRFELLNPCGLHAFQACALDRYATPPRCREYTATHGENQGF